MADVVVNNDNTHPMELLGQGVRAYVLQDYTAAVSALSKASELLAAEHGDDMHDSLADVYLYYGKALLGLSREDTEALGDAVKNQPDSDEEEEELENTETDEADEKKEGDDVKMNGAGDVGSSDGKSENSTDKTVKTNGTEPSGSTPADTEEQPDDEEPTDLQVAWEVLELAKKIYQKRGENGKKNLAETLVILGEVSLESENFEAAVNDIKEGLRMQKELFPEDSRTVAETHYKLGMAYSTNTQIDEAVENFNASLVYLRNRVATLEKEGDGAEEILEIKGLVPDIEEKIADMKSYKDEVCQCDVRTTIREFVGKPKFAGSANKIEVRRKPTLEAALNQTIKQIMSVVTVSKPTSAGGASSSSAAANSSKPATDISHLVKRKRKLEEVTEDAENEAEASPAK